MKFFGLKENGQLVDVTFGEFEDTDSLKKTLEPNPENETVKKWLAGSIEEIKYDEYLAFQDSKKQKDEQDSVVVADELANEDVKSVLVALVNGQREVAKSILEKSRKKPKGPVKEEPAKEQ